MIAAVSSRKDLPYPAIVGRNGTGLHIQWDVKVTSPAKQPEMLSDSSGPASNETSRAYAGESSQNNMTEPEWSAPDKHLWQGEDGLTARGQEPEAGESSLQELDENASTEGTSSEPLDRMSSLELKFWPYRHELRTNGNSSWKRLMLRLPWHQELRSTLWGAVRPPEMSFERWIPPC
jgi:hypothetical protein